MTPPVRSPSAQRDFYQVLGVARDAPVADIRAAFARLAKLHHPDHGAPTVDLSARLADVQQAYRCLSDADARARHDRVLEEAERLHFMRQRTVQRRLRRYDGRHPHPVPRPYQRFRWRMWLLALLGAAIVAQISLRLMA